LLSVVHNSAVELLPRLDHTRWLLDQGWWRSSSPLPLFWGEELLGFLFLNAFDPAVVTPPALQRLQPQGGDAAPRGGRPSRVPDGRGHSPDLHGEQISQDARILAVADIHDALTQIRVDNLPSRRLRPSGCCTGHGSAGAGPPLRSGAAGGQ
jgi:hypothetical protein